MHTKNCLCILLGVDFTVGVKRKKMTGQTILEYVVVVGIVTTVLVVMSPYLKRGIQSIVKVTADQLAPQNEAEQNVYSKAGYLVEAFSASRAKSDKDVREATGGITEYKFGDTTETYSNSISNLGFTERVN